jgi:hypothetical protein
MALVVGEEDRNLTAASSMAVLQQNPFLTLQHSR